MDSRRSGLCVCRGATTCARSRDDRCHQRQLVQQTRHRGVRYDWATRSLAGVTRANGPHRRAPAPRASATRARSRELHSLGVPPDTRARRLRAQRAQRFCGDLAILGPWPAGRGGRGAGAGLSPPQPLGACPGLAGRDTRAMRSVRSTCGSGPEARKSRDVNMLNSMLSRASRVVGTPRTGRRSPSANVR